MIMENNTVPLVELQDVSARVKLGNGEWLTTVNSASMLLNQGETYAVVGRSGSGKTSLISIIGFLNKNFTGKYYYFGKSIQKCSDATVSHMRARNIGFVFQNYSLIKHLSIRENVELPLLYAGLQQSKQKRRKTIEEALCDVGLQDKLNEYPGRLSGGEQQRVAIARALVTNPKLLICDEPTGALDSSTGEKVLQVLHDRVQESGTTLLLVTHDMKVARSCSHIFTMEGGVLYDHAA
ncbi:ABC transporter ATP-binding protein [Gardnerella vaginalis]|uniref:ABC transporter ATP-binding protein n=3 Tax=Gardnerella vaginalis TaxID=2702 RepID=A0ABD4ZBV8_GARVA|nr:ABC transporter ATP-binding protein [Gardnerella vaginalis]MDK6695953.1 ABC transporter ATP-binding protein [Gardnerella vaginalis]